MESLKFKRSTILIAEWVSLAVSIFMLFWIYNPTTEILGSQYMADKWGRDIQMSWLHQAVGLMIVFFTIFVVVVIIWDLYVTFESSEDVDETAPFRRITQKVGDGDEHRQTHYNRTRYTNDEPEKTEEETETNNEDMKKKFTLKRAIWTVVLIIVVIYGIKLVGKTYKQSKFVYNTSKIYHNNYQQKVEEKQGYYDKLWKTFYEKKRIANLNKDVFRDITIIIMENRRDGENVTWKWMQENQHIPYGEYTKFYSELSAFIHSQREGYFAIEKQCQQIARGHNTLVDTFPNNLYNRFLKQERIVFEYGMLSDNTLTVFETGTENVSMDEGNTEVEQYESGRKPSTGTPPVNQNEMTDAAMLKLIKDQKVSQ
jgi:hypothetical protein